METYEYSETEDISSRQLPQILRTPTPSLSHLPSCRHEKTKTRKISPRNIKELKDEDAIFFKDDPQLSDVSEKSCSEQGYSEPVQADQLLAAHRRKLIRDLLASFDLEKVMDRYRGDSVRKSLNKRRYRKWLSTTMSVEQANFSDRQWNEEFRQQVLDEFEKKLDDREKKLADAESQRIHKLRIQGILPDEEAEARKADLAMRKTAAEKKFEHRSAKKHHSLFKPNDIETQMEIMNRNERENRRKITGGDEDEDSIDGKADGTSGDVDISRLPTYKSQLGRMKPDTEEVHPQLRDLYEEEDLNQLYKQAEHLVRQSKIK